MTDINENESMASESPDQAEVSIVEDDSQAPVFNRRQVSDVVAREKKKAYEKGKQEALMELQQQQSGQQEQLGNQAAAPMVNHPPVMVGGMQQQNPVDIAKMISEQIPQALQSHVQDMMNKQTVDSFVNKMQAAESKYPGLQEKLNDLDYSAIAPLVQMANSMDNTADIMHEIVTNPMKMANLTILMHTQPKLAQKAMHDLSSSIKQNTEAQEQHVNAREPLSQIKSSKNAGMDSGSLSVKDLQKMLSGR